MKTETKVISAKSENEVITRTDRLLPAYNPERWKGTYCCSYYNGKLSYGMIKQRGGCTNGGYKVGISSSRNSIVYQNNRHCEPSINETMLRKFWAEMREKEKNEKQLRKEKRIAAATRKAERECAVKSAAELKVANDLGFSTVTKYHNHLKNEAAKAVKIAAAKRKSDLKAIGLNAAKVDEVVKNFPKYNGSEGYKMGGEFELKIEGLGVVLRNDTRNYYEGRGAKYNATIRHGYKSITLSAKNVNKMSFEGGVPTVKGKIAEGKIYHCNYWDINGKHEGFITHNYHCSTIAEAKQWIERRISSIRQQHNAALSQIELLKKAQGKFIGLQHSVAAGNCKVGSLNFATRHNLNHEFGYRLDYLISLEPNNQYLMNILRSI